MEYAPVVAGFDILTALSVVEARDQEKQGFQGRSAYYDVLYVMRMGFNSARSVQNNHGICHSEDEMRREGGGGGGETTFQC